MLSATSYNREPRKLWRAFDRSIEVKEFRSRTKATLLALIPAKPYPPHKTNPNMNDLTALGKLVIGTCFCFDSLGAEEKASVADFLEYYSTTVVRATVPPRLQEKISTVLRALDSPEKPNPTFAKVQEIFSRHKDSHWTSEQHEEVNRLFPESIAQSRLQS